MERCARVRGKIEEQAALSERRTAGLVDLHAKEPGGGLRFPFVASGFGS